MAELRRGRATKVLGIIPARGGSKGVPRKNLVQIAGEPLLAYAIRAGQESQRLTSLCVSTEDGEIGALAGSMGCSVVWRPQELAEDSVPIVLAMEHALRVEEKDHGAFDLIVLLQPTSPIRTGGDIDKATQIMLEEPNADSLISVICVDDAHPGRMYHLKRGTWLEPLEPQAEQESRQDLPKIYYRNGAIYACRADLLRGSGRLIGKRRLAFVMKAEWSINIDEAYEVAQADELVRRWKEAGCPSAS
mgnify:CR=1 FL=1